MSFDRISITGGAMKWKQFFTPAKSMNAEETKAYLNQNSGENYTLLDVRQPSEYKENHLPGATLIPLPELSDRINEIDPEKPVLVY